MTEQFTYNELGQPKTHQSFEGVITESIYDNAKTNVPESDPTYKVGTGRLVEQRYFAPNSYNNGSGTPTERMRFQYDAYGRKIKAEKFVGNTNTVSRTESWQYNDRGQLVVESKPEGVIKYEYDSVTGQKTAMMVVKAANWNDALERTEYRYNELGWLTEVKVVERNDVALSTPELTRYGFDLQGRQLRIDNPNGTIQRTEVNTMGAVSRMREYGSDSTPQDLGDNPKRSEFLYSLDVAGRRTSMIEKFWLDTDNNLATPDVPVQNVYTWTYDDSGRLLREIVDSFDNNADRTDTFTMDLFGNRLKRTTDKPSTTYVDEVITYLYNDDDRIVSETLDRQSNSSIDQTTSYTWNGTQQQSKTVSIPATSTVAQTFSYNVQGMLASVVTENRNASNAVTSRTKVDYGYTTQGIRSVSVDWGDSNLNGTFEMGEKTGSTEYLIDGNNHTGYAQTIAETTKNAAGLATKRIVYTYGTDEINQTVSLIDPSTQAITQTSTVTFTHDAHSSVRALTDAAGAIAQVYIYAAYGELIAIHNRIAQSVGTVGDPSLQAQALTTLLYNGEAFDSRIGQLYLRARWYSASNGRFDRLDPFAGNQNDPLSFNKYGFVHGNPVMGTDPTGLTTMGNVMAGIGIGARLVGSFARVAFMGPAAFTRVGLLSVRLSTLYRAGTFGFAGVNSLVLAIKMIRAVSDGQSVKKAFGSSVDDLLAWYPWWYTGKSFETFQSPESLIRQYKTLINSQTIVPPELLASVLLAELTHYNAIDSAGDGFTRGENSIGVAQIRGDTILRQAKNHPDIWPAFYRNDENLNEIENQLWDSGMAIGFLSLSIRVYARNANIELWRWGVMSEPEREALVARMTNAKDQISDYPVQSVGSDFGGVWGISAYRRIKQGDLLR